MESKHALKTLERQDLRNEIAQSVLPQIQATSYVAPNYPARERGNSLTNERSPCLIHVISEQRSKSFRMNRMQIDHSK